MDKKKHPVVHKIAGGAWTECHLSPVFEPQLLCVLLCAHRYTMVSSMPSSPLLSVSKETSAWRSSCGSPWCGGDGYGWALLADCDQASPSKPLMQSERHTNTETAAVRAATLSSSVTAVNDLQEVTRGCLLNELCGTVSATGRLNRSCTIFSSSSSLHSVFSSHASLFNFRPLPSTVMVSSKHLRAWLRLFSIGAGGSPW